MITKTSELCLRPFELSDAPAFAAAALESVETVGVWMPWCHDQYTVADAEAWIQLTIQNMNSDIAYDFGIFTGDGKTLLGGVGLNQINRLHNFGNVGYWVRQSRQGKGVASRAAREMIRFGFDEKKMTRLEIVAAEGNLPSCRVAEKAGGRFECIARNRLVIRGEPRDAAMYSVIPGQRAEGGT
jgi:ribosomal-protein-serine acetyltransferase